ncbi:MAG: cation:dicarboxylate symporter family transporter [Betaproteobacteria bacterium]
MLTETSAPKNKMIAFFKDMSLTRRILLGLVLGVFTGLFFGESLTVLQPIADTYLRLSQMAVIPYLILSLTISVGRMSAHTASKIGKWGIVLMLFFWFLTLVLLAVSPTVFPVFQNASFYSSDLITKPAAVDLLKIFVPANPFDAMSKAVVPGVVLFSLALGVALIGLENKTTLLDNLRILEQAVMRIMLFILKLSPIGVFAMTAITAGTMSGETFQRLQVYFILFAVLSILLTFVVLPVVVSSVMPLRYSEIMRAGKDALFTAFISSNIFIALPLIITQAKSLLVAKDLYPDSADKAISVLTPLAFTFPTSGKLLVLLFVPYAAWLGGDLVPLSIYIEMLCVGALSLFASTQIALPPLFDMLGVGQGYMPLYLSTTILTYNFGALVSAIYLFAFCLLGAGAMATRIEFKFTRILRGIAIIVVVCWVSLYGTRMLLASLVDSTYKKDQLLTTMTVRASLPVRVINTLPTPNPTSDTINPIKRIRDRGVLRVGFAQERMPFSFTNIQSQLVGMDVELAGNLGAALGVTALEFVQIPSGQLVDALANGHIDVLMSLPYQWDSLQKLHHSGSYFDTVVGLAVRDQDRYQFKTIEDIRKRGKLKLGRSADDLGLEQIVKSRLTGVDLTIVELASVKDYFNGGRSDLDGMIMLASSASAWTLLYPNYTVVVPQPNMVRLPVGIATRQADWELSLFIDQWLVIEQSRGAIDRAYAYWVLGQGAEQKTVRWSIKRDVLGW